MLGNYKIRVNTEADGKEAQDLFEQLGFKWVGVQPENGDWYSHLYAEKSSCCYLSPYVWVGLSDKFKEITLPQLRGMVSLYSNGANKSTPAYKQVIKYQSEDGRLFDTEQECINYHNERKLVNLLEDNIYALRHEDGSEVLDLIKQHKDLFLDYLQNI